MELFQTAIFFLAITHALLSDKFLKTARLKAIQGAGTPLVTTYNFLGNITIIFGFWLVPILIVMWINKGGDYTFEYLQTFDLGEPFAYFVLAALGFLQPLRHLLANALNYLCKLTSYQIAFWWSALLIFSSILTGCFSELGIMAVVCGLLSRTFFSLKPSNNLSYLTLSLLLIGLSVGGAILPFNLLFTLEVFNGVNWYHWTIFLLFGWKSLARFRAGGNLRGSLFSKGVRFNSREIYPYDTTRTTADLFQGILICGALICGCNDYEQSFCISCHPHSCDYSAQKRL